jgi:hypothetical protein
MENKLKPYKKPVRISLSTDVLPTADPPKLYKRGMAPTRYQAQASIISADSGDLTFN